MRTSLLSRTTRHPYKPFDPSKGKDYEPDIPGRAYRENVRRLHRWERAGGAAVVTVWLLAIVAGIAWWSFVAWAIYTLVTHFTG